MFDDQVDPNTAKVARRGPPIVLVPVIDEKMSPRRDTTGAENLYKRIMAFCARIDMGRHLYRIPARRFRSILAVARPVAVDEPGPAPHVSPRAAPCAGLSLRRCYVRRSLPWHPAIALQVFEMSFEKYGPPSYGLTFTRTRKLCYVTAMFALASSKWCPTNRWRPNATSRLPISPGVSPSPSLDRL